MTGGLYNRGERLASAAGADCLRTYGCGTRLEGILSCQKAHLVLGPLCRTKFRVLAPNGCPCCENWFGGVYREIERNRWLVFTFAWDNDGPSAGVETLVTITFEERDGKTVQTFHQRPFLNVERRDSHVGGWTEAFDKLDTYATNVAREHAA